MSKSIYQDYITILKEADEVKNTLNIKCNEYLDYIDNPKANVKKAWQDDVSTLDDDFIKSHKDELDEIIENHDNSKYEDDEFGPYRAKYYPVNEEESATADGPFQVAWKHHYDNNPHHWQYWTDSHGELDDEKYDSEKVKLAYIEMLCDQLAMSMQFNNRPDEWYESNKDNMKLYPEEKRYYEDLLKQVCDNKYEN